MILGHSPEIQALLKLVDKVAASKINVLVIGESGTGKELVARAIHERGPLKTKPFIAVNCGAIPENLIESELFGHKRGSFTGAVADKPGLFEAAHGGTLFLDEVGELPLSMQVKLLRAIQDRQIRRVGGNESIPVDVRIIAATNRNLETMVAQGKFREDLYYRLNVILIKTPPLRDRKGDVEILIDGILQKVLKKYGKAEGSISIDPSARALLVQHRWPGNVRELENVLERAVTLVNDGVITASQLPLGVSGMAEAGTLSRSADPTIWAGHHDFKNGPVALSEVLKEVQKAYWRQAVHFCKGNTSEAARLLGLSELEAARFTKEFR